MAISTIPTGHTVMGQDGVMRTWTGSQWLPLGIVSASGGITMTQPTTLSSSTTSTVSVSSHTHMISDRPFRHIGIAKRFPGGRVPVVDRKLTALYHLTTIHEKTSYYELPVESAIEMFGDYNPMYAGRPKKLTMLLLESCTGRASWSPLCFTGLCYTMPALTGVRSTGRRTSMAGVRLLQHWGEKFPPFRPFLNAYLTDKAFEEICSDCFDFKLDIVPKHIQNDLDREPERLIKWEAREYRKIKKEEARQEAIRKSTVGYPATLAQGNGLTGGGRIGGIPPAPPIPPWGAAQTLAQQSNLAQQNMQYQAALQNQAVNAISAGSMLNNTAFVYDANSMTVRPK